MVDSIDRTGEIEQNQEREKKAGTAFRQKQHGQNEETGGIKRKKILTSFKSRFDHKSINSGKSTITSVLANTSSLSPGVQNTSTALTQ